MPINLISEKSAIAEAMKKQYGSILTFPELFSQLKSHIDEWATKTERIIWMNDPFPAYRNKWKSWNSRFRKQEITLNTSAIKDYKEFCHFAGVPFQAGFWQEKLKSDDGEEKNLIFKLLIGEWQKNLDKAQARWRLEAINQARQAFLANLKKWLDLIQQLNQQLSQFGMDFGLWFDESLGDLSEQNIEELKRWASYFANDKGAQQIADLLGKMRQIEKSTQLETITQDIGIKVPIADINSKEEIIGLRLGKELEYALPSELALMADPDTSVLFDLKYLESKLVCFELQGTTYQEEKTEITVEIESQTEEKLGPMILCVDTSGSMSGTPENIAKALALYLGNKAKTQNRQCFVINFSTGIETFEITASKGITDLINFLKKSFHGGTDAAPALHHALTLLQTEGYKKADILMISDFVMKDLPEKLLHEIKTQRESGNQFNSLVIGNMFMENRLKTHFDNEWIYNPQSHKIQELVQFKQSIDRT